MATATSEVCVPCLGGTSTVPVRVLACYDADGLYPPEFLKRLEQDMDTFHVDASWRVFAACERVLAEAARPWVALAGRRCATWDDFKAGFLDEFWNESRQVELLCTEFYGGGFSVAAGLSAREYFAKLARLGAALGESEARVVRCALRNLAPVLGKGAAIVALALPPDNQVRHLERMLRELDYVVAVEEAEEKPADDADAEHHGWPPFGPFSKRWRLTEDADRADGQDDAEADKDRGAVVKHKHPFHRESDGESFPAKARRLVFLVVKALWTLKSILRK